MTALVDEKRLAELRTAAEVGIRMSGLHPHTVHVRPDELAALVEEVFIARAQERPHPDIACRVCGCTDKDCSGCIARTGRPCHWVERDLCSACAPPVAELDADQQAVRLAHELAIHLLHQERAVALAALTAATAVVVSDFEVPLNVFVDRLTTAARIAGGAEAPAPGPLVRAACIHCRQDVALATDVAAIREHSMTCAKSPVVQELQRLQAQVDVLKQECRERGAM